MVMPMEFKAKRVNYYPLMWVLFISSVLTMVSFFFKSFTVNDYYGADVSVYAVDLLNRSSSILINMPEFGLLKIAVLAALSLSVINISMSLWQVSYSNARIMKLVNSLRFAVSGITLIVFIYLTDASSSGHIMMKETLSGALGFNLFIYIFAYIFNLYYGVSDRVSIINYKAISAIAILSGTFLWMLPFLNVGGVEITGVNAVYFPRILEMNYPMLEEIVEDYGLYPLLSQIFLYLFLYNLLWNFVFVITNKSYRRFNLTKYIYSGGYAIFYANYCMKVVGSSIEGVSGIIAIAILYIILGIYTLIAYKLLKRKVYSSVREEMMNDDNDAYYDEDTRFIGNLPQVESKSDESEFVSVDNKRGGFRPPEKAISPKPPQFNPPVKPPQYPVKPPVIQTKPQTEYHIEPKKEEKVDKTDKFVPLPKPSNFRTRYERSYLIEEDDWIAVEDSAIITYKKGDVLDIDIPPQFRKKEPIQLVKIDSIEEAPVEVPDYTIIKQKGLDLIKDEELNETDEDMSEFFIEDEEAREFTEEEKPSETIEETEAEEDDADNSVEDDTETENDLSKKDNSENVKNEEEVISEPVSQDREDEIQEDEVISQEEENDELSGDLDEISVEDSEEEPLTEDEIFIKEISETQGEVLEEREEVKVNEIEDIKSNEDEVECKTPESLEESISEIPEDVEEIINDSEDKMSDDAEMEIIEETPENIQEVVSDGEAIVALPSDDGYLFDKIKQTVNTGISEENYEEVKEIDLNDSIEEEKSLEIPEEKPVKEEQSYSKMMKILEDDSDEEIEDYIKKKPSYKNSDFTLETEEKESLEKLSVKDFMPETVKSVIDDNFYNTLPYRTKKEFMTLFMNPNILSISRLPQYIIGGDNTAFFATVIKYMDVIGKTISSELMLLLYEYVVSLYSEDTEFVSNCNRKILDISKIREDKEVNLIDISEEVCIKEIKMMLKLDLVKTMPVVKRLTLIFIRKKKYEEALQLCETAIKLNFTDNTVGGYEGRKKRILKMMEKERTSEQDENRIGNIE